MTREQLLEQALEFYANDINWHWNSENVWEWEPCYEAIDAGGRKGPSIAKIALGKQSPEKQS